MPKIKMEPKNRCLIWHRWLLTKDTGQAQYHQCRDCGARFARGASYEAIDHLWVVGFKEGPPHDLPQSR